VPARGQRGTKPGPGRPPREVYKPTRNQFHVVRTPATAAQVLVYLSQGHTRTAAAAQAGMHRSTLYDWVRDDPAFAEQVDMAEALAEAKIADTMIVQATSGADWRATLAWLQHRRRVDWRPPTNSTEVSGPDGGPVSVDDARAKVTRVLDQYAATLQTKPPAGQPKPE